MKFIVRYFFFMAICFACPRQAFTQTHSIDSLENVLKHSTGDSVRVFAFVNLASQCFSYDSVKAFRYLEQGYVLVRKLKWDYVTGSYYQNKAIMRNFATDLNAANLLYDTAIIYFQKAVDGKRNTKEGSDAKLSIATCMGDKASFLSTKGRNEESIAAYLTALEIWKASGDLQKYNAIGTYYGRISTIYYNLNLYEKALEYDKLSLSNYILDGSEEAIAWALIYVCDDFNTLHLLDSSLVYLGKAKPIVEKLNNYRLNIQYYNKLGSISRLKKDYKGAIVYFNKTLDVAKETHNQLQTIASYKMIGLCYLNMEDYTAARKYLLIALPLALESRYMKEKIEVLQQLVNVEEKTNNKSQAFTYLKQLTVIKDSADVEASKNAIAEIENKYQGAQKEKEIIQLQKDKQIQSLSIKQKSILNYILFGSIAVLLIISFLAYRNIRHRHLLAKKETELQKHQIRELEKDRQLVAVDSMLKGQEEERSRLAKDLHDGLGGLLSGVKFSLSNMKDNLIITPDNMAVFERSLDMIDTSIKELRRVAHNMMPEMLTKFGLDEALKEYCNTINTTKLLTVKYQSLGMDGRVDKSTEIIVYRIIQELLNNIMKHAGATEAFVQLIRENSRLNIVVEDNGKGFDTTLLEQNKGAGWVNIRSRVDYLKGQLDVHSEPGKGTLVNIEFNV
jgi:two-component system NarL family sensor kinase